MKRLYFAVLPLFCGIAMASMLAGCSSKPEPAKIQEGLDNYMVMNFNIFARYSRIPDNQKDISVKQCRSLSDGILDEMHIADEPRPYIKKNGQLCHVTISDGTNRYKVLVVTLRDSKDRYNAKPVFISETTDQETKDGHILFN